MTSQRPPPPPAQPRASKSPERGHSLSAGGEGQGEVVRSPSSQSDRDPDLKQLIGKLELRRDDLARLIELQKNVAALEAALFVNSSADKVISLACEIVSRRYQVPLNRLLSKDRPNDVAHPRQIVFYLVRHNSKATLEQIGKPFHKDRGAVSWGIRAVADRKSICPGFAAELCTLQADLSLQLAKLQTHAEP